MTNGIYTTLTRQAGLMREMQVVAHNIANASTTGYRAESVIFAEHVQDLGNGSPSLSMATASGHVTRDIQGGLTQTGGTLDFAIEGPGYFMIEAPDGQRLTRAGAFMSNGQGDLVTPEGHRVLDAGGTPIFIPPDAASIHLSPDGTLSADGRPVAQIGVFQPGAAEDLSRRDGVSFATTAVPEPLDAPRVVQGFVEASNVEPVSEVARMIEVQHAYQMGQGFMDREDERLKSITRLLGR